MDPGILRTFFVQPVFDLLRCFVVPAASFATGSAGKINLIVAL
jgi:hypothetical protein